MFAPSLSAVATNFPSGDERSTVHSPLALDLVTDAPVCTTVRGLARVAHVAIEAALRFEREGNGRDAFAWMVEPCDLLDGLPPVEACLELRYWASASLLHALGLDEGDDEVGDRLDELVSVEPDPARPMGDRVDAPNGGHALYTAVGASGRTGGFVAAVCADVLDMEEIVDEAFGGGRACCRIRQGFDPAADGASRYLSARLEAEVSAAVDHPVPGWRLLVRAGIDA